MFESVTETSRAGGRILPDLTTAKVDLPALSDRSLVDLVVAAERLAAQATGLGMAAIAELSRRPGPQTAGLQNTEDEYVEALDELAGEVGAGCRWSRTMAEHRVQLAVDLDTRLPATLAALRAGRIDLNRARAIADATQLLEDHDAATVEDRVLPRAPEQTTAQLRASLRRAVIVADPRAAERRHEHEVAKRRVEVRPLPDGIAELSAPMRADHAEAAYARLTELARQALRAHRSLLNPAIYDDGPDGAQPGSPLEGAPPATAPSGDGPAAGVPDEQVPRDHPTLDTLRSDVLLWLILGEPMPGLPLNWARTTPCTATPTTAGPHTATPNPTGGSSADPPDEFTATGPSVDDSAPADASATVRDDAPAAGLAPCAHCGAPRQRPLVQVVVPVGTLLGITDEPAQLAGYGPIPAGLARELAANAPWRRLLTDPVTGTTIASESSSYTPPPAMAAFVRARDGTCRFPGCRQPAARADLDHSVPWPHGPTCPCNLCALCRFHHLLKTLYGWKASLDPKTARLTWTSPRGRRYITNPEGIPDIDTRNSAVLRLARLNLRRTG